MLTRKTNGKQLANMDRFYDDKSGENYKPNNVRLNITSIPRVVQRNQVQPCGSLCFHLANPHKSSTIQIPTMQEQTHPPDFIDFLGVGL